MGEVDDRVGGDEQWRLAGLGNRVGYPPLASRGIGLWGLGYPRCMSDSTPSGNGGGPPGGREQTAQGAGSSYDARGIELRRQREWEARDAFRTPPVEEGRTGIYIKASAPFTSGNVHIGHVRSYAIGDAYARFQRARGEPVLFAFGFDAFGLPAELGAIANGESPSAVGGALRGAHDRPAQAARVLLRLGAHLHELRGDHVPLVAVALPDAAPGRT